MHLRLPSPSLILVEKVLNRRVDGKISALRSTRATDPVKCAENKEEKSYIKIVKEPLYAHLLFIKRSKMTALIFMILLKNELAIQNEPTKEAQIFIAVILLPH